MNMKTNITYKYGIITK